MKKTKVPRDINKMKAYYLENGVSPLEFMLKVMNDSRVLLGIRLEAAKSAAPYIHSKMPIEIESVHEIQVVQPYIPSRRELGIAYSEDIIDEVTNKNKNEISVFNNTIIEGEILSEDEKTDLDDMGKGSDLGLDDDL